MSTEKNILLLSMSTLNDPKESCYEGPSSEECYFCGVSQLEIGTKYYLRKMDKGNQKIDKIFIVESPEARCNPVKMGAISKFLSGPLLFIKPIKNLNEPEGDLVTNAVDFYKERVAQYIRGTEQSCELLKYTKLPIEKIEDYEKKEKVLGEKYPQEFIQGEFFTDIAIPEATNSEYEKEEDLLNVSVQDLCNQIKEIAESNATVNLYLDMQGARRYETFIINAVVNMLDIYSNIKVKQAVAIDYHGNNNEDGLFNQIIDTTFNDRMFKMVSGMNQFITTGRGDLLRQFFDRSQYLEGIDLSSENPIITAVNNISDALAVCNMAKFSTEIGKFKDALVTYKEAKKPNRLFQIFVEDLESDYNEYELLNDEAISPIVNRVKWCYSKRLYQQAMTLLEAHVPDDIVKNKIIYYGDEGRLRNLRNSLQTNDWWKTNVYNDQTDAYVFVHYLLMYFCDTDEEEEYAWRINDKFVKVEEHFTCTVGCPDTDFRTEEDLQKGEEHRYWNREIGELLYHYDVIRKIRNRINHSYSHVFLERRWQEINVDLVERKIKAFIECYDRLLSLQVQVDLSEQFSIISD